MDIQLELVIVLKLIVSFLLGAFVGFDREKQGMDAGIRTYAAVCVGATLFTSVAAHITGDVTAASRIIANIATGIGFLGAGIIYRNNDAASSHGLTTAATVWCVGAVGVAVGLNMYIISIAGACALYFLLSLHRRKWYRKWQRKMEVRHTDEGINGKH